MRRSSSKRDRRCVSSPSDSRSSRSKSRRVQTARPTENFSHHPSHSGALSPSSDGLSYLTLNETSPEVVLNSFTNAALQLIYQHEEKTTETASKKAIVHYLAGAMRDVAAKAIVSNLSHSELKTLVDSAKISYGARNKPTKVVLKKRLYECLSKRGLQVFLERIDESKRRTDAASLLCDAIEIEPHGTLRQTLEALSRELSNIGFQAFFDSYPASKLHDICFELGLDNPNVHSKPELIKAIVERKTPKRLARRRSEPTFTKIKRPIVRGLTYQDLFQHYQVPELREYCATHNLVKSGRKKVLIQRILAFLDGGDAASASSTPSSPTPPSSTRGRVRKRGRSNASTSSPRRRQVANKRAKVPPPSTSTSSQADEPADEAHETASAAPSSRYRRSRRRKAFQDEQQRRPREERTLLRGVVDIDHERYDTVPPTHQGEEDSCASDDYVDDDGDGVGKGVSDDGGDDVGSYEAHSENLASEDSTAPSDHPHHEEELHGHTRRDELDADEYHHQGDGLTTRHVRREDGGAEDAPLSSPSSSATTTTKHSPDTQCAVEAFLSDRLDKLDLDKLDEQPIEVLMAYCQEEDLKVRGKTKEHYIEAILEYNDVEEIDLDKMDIYDMETLQEYCQGEGLGADLSDRRDMIEKILAYNDDDRVS